MIGHLRITSPWAQLGVFLGLFGASFLLSSLGMILILIMNGFPIMNMKELDWSQPEVLPTMKWLQALSSLFLFLVPAVLYAIFTFTKKPFYFLGLRKPERRRMYGIGILCIVLAFPFVFWLGELNQHIPMQEWMTKMEKDAMKQMEAFLKVNNSMDIIINVIIIALLPAFCEELCFRGALQRILIHCFKSPWAGIIVTSILFSALHLQFQGFLPRVFLGIILGALYWYSGSLWTSIIAHFVNNAVQVIAVSFAPEYVTENPAIPIYFALISGVTVFVLLWIYQRISTVTYSKVYEYDKANETNQFWVS